MTKLYFKQKLFERLIIVLLLLPVISFLMYALTGLFFNFNTVNFIIYISLIVLLLTSVKQFDKTLIQFFKFFRLILLANLVGHICNQGVDGVVDFLRTISGYYIFVIMGMLMYVLYYRSNQLEIILRYIVKAGVFISTINLLQYIFITTDNYIHSEWSIEFNNYQIMIDYLNELNKSFFDYILIGLNYDNIIRPIGFFYDTHSQYYFPLISSVILLYNKKLLKNSIIWICFMFTTILLSSIKTAILTIFILFIIWLLLHVNLKKLLKYIIPITLVVLYFFRGIILTILMGDNMIKILYQLFNHLIFVPLNFISTNIIGFFIGGTSFLRDDPNFYSEVFWVTVTFYIGIVGLLVYLRPLRLIRVIKNPKWSMGVYIYFVFVLSLVHYGVYSVGVNNVVSALPIMFYLAYMSSLQKKKST